MSKSFPNPDETIARGTSALRSASSTVDPDQLTSQLISRSRHRQFLRIGSSIGAVAAGVAGVCLLLFPRRAMADLPTVLRATMAQKAYFYRIHSWSLLKQRYELDSVTNCWHFSDREVTIYDNRRVDHQLEPRMTLANCPSDHSTMWLYSSGRMIDLNSRFPFAVDYEGKLPVQFPQMPTLDKLKSDQFVVQMVPGVKAHGGVFDMYVSRVRNFDGFTRFETYVDPETHLIRFMDMPKSSTTHTEMKPNAAGNGYEMAPDGSPNDWNEYSTEFRYPSDAELEAGVPKPPKGEQLVKSLDLKAKFKREILKPVGSQVVGGITKKLYAVVIRAPGAVYAITDGGAPRSSDSHIGIQVEGCETRPDRDHVSYIEPNTSVPGPNGKVLHFRFPYKIGSRKYLIESSLNDLSGPVPQRITVKIPVWRYDRKHSIAAPEGYKEVFGVSTLYPSKLVGFATFTTDRIYALPGGFGNGTSGAKLPSEF